MGNLYLLLPKVPKMRAINDTMPLIAHSTGGAECASVQTPGHLWHPTPALLHLQ